MPFNSITRTRPTFLGIIRKESLNTFPSSTSQVTRYLDDDNTTSYLHLPQFFFAHEFLCQLLLCQEFGDQVLATQYNNAVR